MESRQPFGMKKQKTARNKFMTDRILSGRMPAHRSKKYADL
jgi:hypothetical protein